MGAREDTQMLVIDFFKTPLLMGYVDGFARAAHGI